MDGVDSGYDHLQSRIAEKRPQRTSWSTSKTSSTSPSADTSQHGLDLKSLKSTLAHVSNYIQNANPIPNSLLTKLNSYTVDSDTFLALDKAKERVGARYLYLEDGKIRLDTYTQPPHAEVIGEILRQIAIQDNVRLLISGSGGDVPLGQWGVKQPDAHWTINQRRLPVPPPPGTFGIGAGGNPAPQLVLEVAVSHESIPTLTERDLQRYFAAGTGTRWWVGLKIFKNPTGTTRWWAGHAERTVQNGNFIDTATLHVESMPVVQSHNLDISIPTNLVFNIRVATLTHPAAPPANYPQYLTINLEEIRQIVIELL